MLALLIGFGLGFVTAIPVAGPVSAFVFSLGMKGRFAQARIAAIGAAVVEGGYAFLAFWGFSQLLDRVAWAIYAANGVAAVVLGVLGVYFFRSKKMRVIEFKVVETDVTRSVRAFFTGAGMSAANPSLIATWSASIAALYSMKLLTFSSLNAGAFAVGIATGISVWFALFISLILRFRTRFRPEIVDKILKTAGVGLMVLAAALL